MGKINTVSLCDVTGLCLLAGFAVKTVADYSRYSSVQNSAPFSAMGPEGVQGASGKPPGRLCRGETFCDTGESKIGSFPCLAQENCFLWEVSSACGRTRYFPTRESTQRVPGAAKGCMSHGRPRTPRC